MIGFFVGVVVGALVAAVWFGLRRRFDEDQAAALVEAVQRHPLAGGLDLWFCQCGSWGFFSPEASRDEAGVRHEPGRCGPLREAL